MARLLITHAYFYYYDPKQWVTKKPYPPLGTLFAASLLRNEGHDVHFFDNALQKDTSAFHTKLKSVKPDYLIIYDDGFNYLTKMCLTNMRQAAFEMASMAKALNIPVFVSSSDSTDQYNLYLHHDFDYVILGEGEETLKELFALEDDRPSSPEDINGLAFISSGEVKRTSPRPVLRNLDDLPMPAWDLIEMDSYQRIWLDNHGYFSLNISTTRGCPYKCNWCAKPIYGNRYNSRSPQIVVEEMAMLQEKFAVDQFWVTDDIFGLKPNWVHEFADIIDKKGLHFNYKIQSRVDLMLKDNNVDAMVRSGLDEVWVGAESGSQKILDAMDKGITIEEIRQATSKVKAHGKRICFFLQFGYLGETKEDVQKTIDLLLELMPDDIGISVSYPLPGTIFFEKVKSQLKEKANWTDSDDLDMMYEGSYSKAYYRNLHRLVHKLYRRNQGMAHIKRPINEWTRYRGAELRAMILGLVYYTPGAMYHRMAERKLIKQKF